MCVITDKNVKRTLAFALVPIAVINLYAGSKVVGKSLNEKVDEIPSQTIIATVDDYVVTSPAAQTEKSEFEKLYDIYIASGMNLDEILNTCDVNSELYISGLYVKLKNAGIPDDIIKKELHNIMMCGYSYTDTTEEVWLSMFGNILPTVSWEYNIMDYYYPLAKYIHFKECELEHISEYGDGRVTCNTLQEEFNNNFYEITYLDYVTDMVNTTDDVELITSLQRIINSNVDSEACLYELETIYEMAKIPMCVPEDLWNNQFRNLLQTVSNEENVCEIYYKLACYVHMLHCDYEHNITEFGTIECDVKELVLKNL